MEDERRQRLRAAAENAGRVLSRSDNLVPADRIELVQQVLDDLAAQPDGAPDREWCRLALDRLMTCREQVPVYDASDDWQERFAHAQDFILSLDEMIVAIVGVAGDLRRDGEAPPAPGAGELSESVGRSMAELSQSIADIRQTLDNLNIKVAADNKIASDNKISVTGFIVDIDVNLDSLTKVIAGALADPNLMSRIWNHVCRMLADLMRFVRDHVSSFQDHLPTIETLAAEAERFVVIGRRIFTGSSTDGADAPAPTPSAGESPFALPPLNLLAAPSADDPERQPGQEPHEENARRLKAILDAYGVGGRISSGRAGPVVTRYDFAPDPGTRTDRIAGLASDFTVDMGVGPVRIAPVPEQPGIIGIELPNSARSPVFLRDLLSATEYRNATSPLPLALGAHTGGAPVTADLDRMPHLLIAGGDIDEKGACINAMVLSLLFRALPDRCRLILIDPRMLDFAIFHDIPHLLTPVVTDVDAAQTALDWTVGEMERRYRAMADRSVRNIAGYNQNLAGGDAPLPYITIVISDFADLITAPDSAFELTLARIAQMAHAAGIHVIAGTQRPSLNVVSGLVKASLPVRIALKLASRIESRTVLDEQGAEQLLGAGDMLLRNSRGDISRLHGPMVSDDDVRRVADYLRARGRPRYVEGIGG